MSKSLRALFLGSTDEAVRVVRKHFLNLEEVVCTTIEDLEKLLVKGAGGFHLVMAGPGFTDATAEELAQTLRMAFQEIPVYYVSDRVDGYDRAELMKHGFHEAFLLPIDRDYLGKVLAYAAIQAEHMVYTPVKLVDIEPGTKLDFEISIFLPANNKYIAYSAIGDKLDPDRLKRLKQYRQSSVYVPADQIDNFYRYSAQRLTELAIDGSSQTEQQEKLRDSVRELLMGTISESYAKHIGMGKKAVDHTRQIVRKFILLKNPDDWYGKLMSEIGRKSDSYSHASTVATFAALFSLILRIGDPEEMAIAGVLHDVGISMLPPKLQDMRVEKMSPVELEVYKSHPKMGVSSAKTRNLTVPESALTAIAQHHERWNGSGYPDKLSKKSFALEGQLLAMADRFDYLTRAESHVSVMSPDQAFRQLLREEVADPDLLKHLSLIFEREHKAAG